MIFVLTLLLSMLLNHVKGFRWVHHFLHNDAIGEVVMFLLGILNEPMNGRLVTFVPKSTSRLQRTTSAGLPAVRVSFF